MPNPTTELPVETTEAPDRRAAIEAAFEATYEQQAPKNEDSGSKTPETQSVLPEAAGTPEGTGKPESSDEPAGEGAPEGGAKDQETDSSVAGKESEVDDAPHAWKAPLRAKWATVDPEVRQEISRREREMAQMVDRTAVARQFTKSFAEAVQPYQQRLQAMGVHPIKAVQGLLAADYQLATGSKTQRAQLIGKLIQDYDVDIATLDSVLAGNTSPEAQEEARLNKLLQQHLAPLQNKLQTYEQRDAEIQQSTEAQQAAELEAMVSDTKKFPHFAAVKNTMADLIEISARRGVSLDLATAYNRAVAADPQLFAQMEQARQAEQVKQAALQAQRAKAASASVAGAPSGRVGQNAAPSDRRTTIAAALSALGG